MKISLKKVAWHYHIVLCGLIKFSGHDTLHIAFLRPAMRRWSRSQNCWIYARFGKRIVGELTK
jgi:hypothetical protein